MFIRNWNVQSRDRSKISCFWSPKNGIQKGRFSWIKNFPKNGLFGHFNWLLRPFFGGGGVQHGIFRTLKCTLGVLALRGSVAGRGAIANHADTKLKASLKFFNHEIASRDRLFFQSFNLGPLETWNSRTFPERKDWESPPVWETVRCTFSQKKWIPCLIPWFCSSPWDFEWTTFINRFQWKNDICYVIANDLRNDRIPYQFVAYYRKSRFLASDSHSSLSTDFGLPDLYPIVQAAPLHQFSRTPD